MDKIISPLWRQELKASIHKEGKSRSSRWIQLATINKENKPRVRSVVFRGWHSQSSMLVYSDKRSDKFHEINHNNNVEVLWLFSKSRAQFRFKGIASFLKEKESYWQDLTTESKKLWFWPSPGLKINKDLKQITISHNEIPDNFIVFSIKIISVDLLKLEHPIHKRYLWEETNSWKVIELNP